MRRFAILVSALAVAVALGPIALATSVTLKTVPTIVPNDAGGHTLAQNQASGFFNSNFAGNFNVYIEWANTSGAAWAANDQAIIRGFITGVGSSPYWHLLDPYGQGHVSASGLTIAGECTKTESAQPDAINCASLYTAGCGFSTTDPHAIYAVLPADGTLALAAGGGGCHTAFHSGQGLWADSCTSCNDAGAFSVPIHPSPNASPMVDGQVSILWHEIAEAVASTSGFFWIFDNSSLGEVADQCSFDEMGNVQGYTDAGIPYSMRWNNVADGGYPWSFAAQGLMQGSPFWQCLSQPVLNSSLQGGVYGHSCATIGDCATVGLGGYQLNCVAGKCVLPNCYDGVKDGTETDIDCGGDCDVLPGDTTHRCAPGKACKWHTDCKGGTLTCSAGVCQ